MRGFQVHFIADCKTCGMHWEGMNDDKAAYQHAYKMKHTVIYERGIAGSWEYGKKDSTDAK